MLYQIDGAENLIQQATYSNEFFVQIGYLIFTKQFIEIIPKFEDNFGNNWTKRYKDILQNSYHGKVYDLAIIN